MGRKRLILVGVVLVFITVVVIAFISYQNSFQKLTIDVEGNSQATATIYRAATGDGVGGYAHQKEVIRTMQAGETLRLKKGVYVVILPEKNGYKEIKQRFTLANEAVYIDLEPDYTDEKLTRLLQEQTNTIQQAITNKYPRNIPSTYQVNPGKLYKQGDWYATTLTYKNQSDIFNNDTVRLVAHKVEGSWEIVTNPPAIVISKVVYPDIPGEVVDDINNQ